MKQTRAVWIVNCSSIVEYLDTRLQDFVEIYPWLGEGPAIDKSWNWRNFQQGRKSQKEQFIDWVICKYLCEQYFMDIPNHNAYYELVWGELFQDLRLSATFEELFLDTITVPYPVSGEPLSYSVQRSCGSLLIEFQAEPGTKFHFNMPWH